MSKQEHDLIRNVNGFISIFRLCVSFSNMETKIVFKELLYVEFT